MRKLLPGVTREKAWIVCVLFLAGVFVAVHASQYYLGTLRAMGPGYFPLFLGVSLCIVAVLIAFEPASAPPPEDQAPPGGRLRPVVFVFGGILLFAGLVRTAGFVPAVLACVVCAGLAESRNRLWELLLLGAAVTLFAGLVFVYGLGIPVRLIAL